MRHLMPPYWGPTPPAKTFNLPYIYKVINTLDFTRDLNSLLGLALVRKGKSWRKLELEGSWGGGKKFMEI